MRGAMLATGCLAVTSLVAVGACAPRERPYAEPSRVEFLAPADGDTVDLPVTIRLDAHGVAIVPATGLREEGEGHHHLVVDLDLPPFDQPIPVGDGFIHMGTGVTEWVLENLTPGPHRLIAVVGWGDHVPIGSVAADTIHIVVR